jgi:hypothetical protein
VIDLLDKYAAKLEAQYQNAMDPINFQYQTQPKIASVAYGAPYQSVAQPSDFSKVVAGISGVKDIGSMLFG